MHINVVGGGVVGLCCAIELLDAGHRVRVLDDDAAGEAASWGNAGHIAAEQVEPLASPASLASAFRRRFQAGGALHMPVRALPRWLPFAARFVPACAPWRVRAGSEAMAGLLADALPDWRRLAAALGQRSLVQDAGHFVAWENGPGVQAGAARWRSANTGTASLREADDGELAQLRQLARAPIAGAVRFAGTGQVADLDALRVALTGAVLARGGELLRTAATLRILEAEAQVPGHDADAVLVAAGVRSRALLEPLGHRVPLIAERGYHIRARTDAWPTGLPPVVFEDRSMIVTGFAGCVQAASFLEFNDWRAPPDERKWQRLERHVAQLGLPFTPPFSRWMGSRPTLPDYLPAIGRSRRATNLYYAFGHQHLGLTLAPVTARRIAALLSSQAAPATLAPFDLARF